MRLLGLFLSLAAGAAFAGEYAVLASGSRLRVDRHEADGAKVRLYTGAGFVEMDAASVRGYEAEDWVAPGCPVGPPAPVALPPLSPAGLADAAADKYGLPRRLVRSVIAHESGFQPRAVSPKGAVGLMQLMPSTARTLGADPHDAAQNVDAGTRYLRDLLVKYNGGLWRALAAYNAGAGAVDKYKDVPPYRETVNYVRKIDQDYRKGSD
jgi:soluble lytic murein transglycosylase-like protein